MKIINTVLFFLILFCIACQKKITSTTPPIVNMASTQDFLNINYHEDEKSFYHRGFVFKTKMDDDQTDSLLTLLNKLIFQKKRYAIPQAKVNSPSINKLKPRKKRKLLTTFNHQNTIWLSINVVTTSHQNYYIGFLKNGSIKIKNRYFHFDPTLADLVLAKLHTNILTTIPSNSIWYNSAQKALKNRNIEK